MSRNSTETSTVFFSSSVALGFCSSSRLTASGTNFDSSPLSCSSSSSRCARLLKMLQRGRQLGVLALQLLRGPWASRAGHVVEGGAELADLVAGGRRRPRLEVAVADAPGGAAESCAIGRTTTRRMATVSTAAAASDRQRRR